MYINASVYTNVGSADCLYYFYLVHLLRTQKWVMYFLFNAAAQLKHEKLVYVNFCVICNKCKSYNLIIIFLKFVS